MKTLYAYSTQEHNIEKEQGQHQEFGPPKIKIDMKAFTTLILLFFAISCKKASVEREVLEVCGVSDPIVNLEWLNSEFEELEGGPEINGIVLYTYGGKDVIEVQNSVFSSTNQHQYYCDGTKLDLNDPDAFNKFKRERVETRLLYGTKIW